MNILAIMAVVAKGIDLATKFIAIGKNAVPVLESVGGLIASAQAGTVTDAELTATDQSLDAMLDEFNAPI
jgi:hypothetical protein